MNKSKEDILNTYGEVDIISGGWVGIRCGPGGSKLYRSMGALYNIIKSHIRIEVATIELEKLGKT